MNDDTFIFLDEFLDTELYIFLNKCKEEILKFVWKEKNIEIIGKYQEQHRKKNIFKKWKKIFKIF